MSIVQEWRQITLLKRGLSGNVEDVKEDLLIGHRQGMHGCHISHIDATV